MDQITEKTVLKKKKSKKIKTFMSFEGRLQLPSFTVELNKIFIHIYSVVNLYQMPIRGDSSSSI